MGDVYGMEIRVSDTAILHERVASLRLEASLLQLPCRIVRSGAALQAGSPRWDQSLVPGATPSPALRSARHGSSGGSGRSAPP